jgi:hypothetical protein
MKFRQLTRAVGVHTSPQLALTGDDLYNKNVTMIFGRCPARSLFTPSFQILKRRQHIFGTIGESQSLIDRVVGFSQGEDGVKEAYHRFEKGIGGKVLFDPWN